MRTLIVVAIVIVGFSLQVVSYVWLSPPFGAPASPAFSNPRLPFSPLLFILGVMLVFVAAVVYELLPEREQE